ncbi:hypothetical protein NDU88_003301 [Pleurodeles waltl]|uniref:Uncharacterized protein n=1 Tax=Pleurodeles waltl TaxID=8319 RepID=A0AAV7SFL2_PLEWA|nr:hypothetical protein NDU88_003301 [Pleurodeles waltl]
MKPRASWDQERTRPSCRLSRAGVPRGSRGGCRCRLTPGAESTQINYRPRPARQQHDLENEGRGGRPRDIAGLCRTKRDLPPRVPGTLRGAHWTACPPPDCKVNRGQTQTEESGTHLGSPAWDRARALGTGVQWAPLNGRRSGGGSLAGPPPTPGFNSTF